MNNELIITREQAQRYVLGLCSKCWAMNEADFKAWLMGIQSTFADKTEIRSTLPAWAKTEEDEYDGYGYEVHGGAAVIKIHGALVKTFNLWDHLFGMVSMQMIQRDFQNALNDDSVDTIFFDVDSPGGTVDGTKELVDFIYEARGQKPLVVYGNGSMMSGAYYVGSVGDEVYTSDTSYVGSIGVYRPHMDASKFYENWGIKVTLIYAGKEKVAGNPYEKLSDKDKEILQREVDKQYDIFVDTVARNRGVDKKVVLEKMADGRVFIGQDAMDNGLVDGLVTLAEVQEYVKNFGVKGTDSGSISNPKTKGSVMPFGKKGTLEDLTVDAVKEQAPEIYQTIYDAGAESSKEDAAKEKDAAVNAAVKAEQERAAGIFDLVANKPEMLGEAVELYKAGKSVGDAAQELLKKTTAKQKKEDKQDKFDKGAADVQEPVKDGDDAASDGTNETPAERWNNDTEIRAAYQNAGGRQEYMKHMAEWLKDQKAQDEFAGDLDAYLAYKRNQK